MISRDATVTAPTFELVKQHATAKPKPDEKSAPHKTKISNYRKYK